MFPQPNLHQADRVRQQVLGLPALLHLELQLDQLDKLKCSFSVFKRVSKWGWLPIIIVCQGVFQTFWGMIMLGENYLKTTTWEGRQIFQIQIQKKTLLEYKYKFKTSRSWNEFQEGEGEDTLWAKWGETLRQWDVGGRKRQLEVILSWWWWWWQLHSVIIHHLKSWWWR